MDLSLLESRLNSYGFQTSLITFEELQFEDNEENCYYLCGSHQNIDVKAYLDDVLASPDQNDGMTADTFLSANVAHLFGGCRLDIYELRSNLTMRSQPLPHSFNMSRQFRSLTDDGDIRIGELHSSRCTEANDSIKQNQ